jgi:2-oxo-hept-3-ene-1,7-dioate hydratase
MLDQQDIEAAALMLDSALSSGTTIGHFSARYPDMTIDDGYAIQAQWTRLRLQQGRRIVGHKIGLTSRAMQLSAQITEPDYGILFDDMVFPDNSEIPFDRFIAPMVEIEIAFVLGERLEGEDISLWDVLRATDYVCPAVEIVDSRVIRIDPESGNRRKVLDTIADNAASAGLITGGLPVMPGEVDLRWAGGILSRNGLIEETGVAAGVLNHPANGVVWLVKRLAAHGIALEAGQVILGGSFTRIVAAERGDTFHADFGSLGSIGFRFV